MWWNSLLLHLPDEVRLVVHALVRERGDTVCVVEHRAEPGEHRLHQRAVERVADGENSTTVAMISDLPVYWPSFYISISQVNLH